MLARRIPALFLKPSPGANFFPQFSPLDHLFIMRALVLRELSIRYQKLRIGFMIEFLQPLVVIFLHYYVFLVLNKFMPGEIPVEIYVLGGFTTWFTVRDITKRTSRTDGRPALLIPGVTPKEFHYLGAAMAWHVTANVSLLYLGLALSELVFGDEPFPNFPASMLVFALAALLGTGARLVFDALIEVWPIVKGVKKAIIFLAFITSGIYFSLQQTARDALQEVAWYNPLDHLLESQRCALYPGYPVAHVTLLYPTAWGLGLTLVGLALKRCLPRWFPR
jgi:ABC-type polysaccharide/polyol phosphate export permease